MTRFFYTKEMVDFVRKNINQYTYKELTKLFNEKFNTNKNQVALQKAMISRYGIVKKANVSNGLKGKKDHKYTNEEIEWLKSHYLDFDFHPDLYAEFNKAFGLNQSEDALHNKIKSLGLFIPQQRIKYTQEQINWIKSNIDSYLTNKEMLKDFNKKFNKNLSYQNFRAWLCKNKIFKENVKRPIQYTKEQDEWLINNLHKYDTGSRYDTNKLVADFNALFKTKYVNNSIRHHIFKVLGIEKKYNTFDELAASKLDKRPLGTEVIEKNGYVYVKLYTNKRTNDNISYLINYRKKSHILYEKYHNVKIDDKKQFVVHINGNKLDFRKENLLLISRSAYLSFKKSKAWEFDDDKLRKLSMLNYEVKHLIKEGE